MRKGYGGEYKCKKENEDIYGKRNCIKVAIGGSSDYLIAYHGKIIKFIEVKETKKERYYPSDRERRQFAELIRLAKMHRVPVELWVYFKRGKGKPTIKHVRHIYEAQKTQEESPRNIKVHRREGTIIHKQRNIPTERPLSQQDERQEPASFREGNSELGRPGKVFRSNS